MKENKTEDRCYVAYKHTAPNNKVYIGITRQNPPEKRWGSNGNGYRNNQYFYNAILKHGWQNFLHEVLFAGLTEEQAMEKEVELIAEYNATNREFGYNISLGGNNIDKIPVLQYTKSLEFVKRWSGAIDASEEVGVSASMIAACCRDKEQSAGGFVWRYEHPESVGNPKGHTNPDTYKPVDQYSVGGEFIATYIHIYEASEKTGVDRSTISKCCQNEQRKSGGFIWRYHGEELTKEHIEWCNGTGKEDVMILIAQYSMDGKFIKIWESTNAITKELGFCNSAIIKCCKNEQKSSYGFIWRYANDGLEELSEEYIKWCNSSIRKRAVIQYSLSGEFIRIYDSVTDACNALGTDSTTSISACCRGKRNKAFGFIWRYLDEIKDPTAPLFHTSTISSLSEAV